MSKKSGRKKRSDSDSDSYDGIDTNTSTGTYYLKGPWQKHEDLLLIQLVKQYGPKDWSRISKLMGEKGKYRLGKQCRERWFNHLSPDVRKTAWTKEEDEIIINYHRKYGNKWTEMVKLLKGRPANAIKNHWNSTLKRLVDSKEYNGVRSKSKKRKQISGEIKMDSNGIFPNSNDNTQINPERDKKQKVTPIENSSNNLSDHNASISISNFNYNSSKLPYKYQYVPPISIKVPPPLNYSNFDDDMLSVSFNQHQNPLFQNNNHFTHSSIYNQYPPNYPPIPIHYSEYSNKIKYNQNLEYLPYSYSDHSSNYPECFIGHDTDTYFNNYHDTN